MNSTKGIVDHRVFSKTYLRKVVFSISYGKLSNECYSSLMEFISTTFGFDVTEEFLANLSNRPLYFGSDDHTLEWCISDECLDILITQEAYHSYAVTLLPLVEIVRSFLIVTDREADEITLHKINLIPVTLSSFDELKDNAAQIFSESILSKWNREAYQRSESALVYLSKEKGENGEDVEVISGFISKAGVAEDQPARYILDLTARHTGYISSDKLPALVGCMNDSLYKGFIGAVVEEIIKSMEEA